MVKWFDFKGQLQGASLNDTNRYETTVLDSIKYRIVSMNNIDFDFLNEMGIIKDLSDSSRFNLFIRNIKHLNLNDSLTDEINKFDITKLRSFLVSKELSDVNFNSIINLVKNYTLFDEQEIKQLIASRDNNHIFAFNFDQYNNAENGFGSFSNELNDFGPTLSYDFPAFDSLDNIEPIFMPDIDFNSFGPPPIGFDLPTENQEAQSSFTSFSFLNEKQPSGKEEKHEESKDVQNQFKNLRS